MKQQTSAATETRLKGKKIIGFTGKAPYAGIDIHQKDRQAATVHEELCSGNHRMGAILTNSLSIYVSVIPVLR